MNTKIVEDLPFFMILEDKIIESRLHSQTQIENSIESSISNDSTKFRLKLLLLDIHRNIG